MKKSLLLSLMILFSYTIQVRSNPQVNDIDSVITSILSNVNSDSIRYVVQNLQDFQTRFLLTPNRFDAADWIENRFNEIGIPDVERDSFMCHTTYMMDTTTLQINIIATIPGTIRPDEVYIIGGHYDCFAYGDPFHTAPGADDNASGTAAALELARALIVSGYQPEATIKFIAFAAEELMLFGDAGCRHYAQNARADGMDIHMMINCDMISNTDSPLEQSRVHINYYSGFESLLNFAITTSQQFSIISALAGGRNQQSDSYPFYAQGYPALYFEEDDFSPFYHSTGDTIGNYSLDFCREVIKSAGATLLKYMMTSTPLSVKEAKIDLPDHINLYQNYPNPFNPTTTINYSIRNEGFVSLRVYNILGQEVAELLNQNQKAGYYSINFNASDLPSGIYIYTIQTSGFSSSKKMLFLK